MITGLMTLMTTSGFAVACLYITLVEQPARLALPPAAMLAQWRISYRRGTAMQLPLAIVSAALAVGAFVVTRDVRWLAGVGCLLTIAPYTLLAMMPVNRQLAAANADDPAAHIAPLVRAWGHRHAARGLLGLAAALFFLAALA